MEAPTILVVCTGNVCRSPLLERLIQRDVDETYGAGAVTVTSAGTLGLEGQPMDARAELVLQVMGGDAGGFVARRLGESHVAPASLVLTASLDHRAQVARMHPKALRRTFTFLELADILAHLPDDELPTSTDPRERIEELVRVAGAHRGLHRPSAADAFDIVDPYRRDDEVYALMQQQVAAAYPHIRRGLTGR